MTNTAQTDGGLRTSYTYDQANQILTAKPAGSGTTTYTHDAAGNRTQANAAGLSTYYGWTEQNQMAWAEPPTKRVTMA